MLKPIPIELDDDDDSSEPLDFPTSDEDAVEEN